MVAGGNTAGRPAQSCRGMKPTAGHVAWLTYGAIVFVLVLAGADLARNDFGSFHQSGQSVLTGEKFVNPDRPDLNPPTFALAMAPLSLLPVGWAFVVWTALGCLALVESLRIIARQVSISPSGWIWIIGAIGGTMPFAHVWHEGQPTWFLLYFVTRAWAVAPHSPSKTGLWLAPAVMIKPPLALLALFLPWRTWGVTALVSAAGTVFVMAVTGLEPWYGWLSKSRDVQWINWPVSVSFWGMAARLQSRQVWGISMAELSTASVVLALLLIVTTAWLLRRTRGDDRWLAAVFFSALASPLGWIHYLTVGLGPFVRAWRRSFVVPVALLTIPLQLLGSIARQSQTGAIILGSTYFIAAFTIVLIVGFDSRRRG